MCCLLQEIATKVVRKFSIHVKHQLCLLRWNLKTNVFIPFYSVIHSMWKHLNQISNTHYTKSTFIYTCLTASFELRKEDLTKITTSISPSHTPSYNWQCTYLQIGFYMVCSSTSHTPSYKLNLIHSEFCHGWTSWKWITQ